MPTQHTSRHWVYFYQSKKDYSRGSFCSYFLEPNVHIVNSKLLPWSLSLNLCENIIWIIPHIKHLQNANFNEIRPSSLAAPGTKLIIRDLGRLVKIEISPEFVSPSSIWTKYMLKKLMWNIFSQTWQRRKHLPQTVRLQLVQRAAPVEDQLVPHQDGGRVQHRQRRDPLLHPLQLCHQQDEPGTLCPLQLHDEHLWEVNNISLS